MRPLTILVSACGAPGTAALLRGLRQNGERDVRLVGTDMSDRAIGRHLGRFRPDALVTLFTRGAFVNSGRNRRER